MSNIPEWVKGLVTEKVASKEPVKVDKKNIEAMFKETIKLANDQISTYETFIGEVSKIGDVTTESRLIDAKKQLIAFVTDLLSVKEGFDKNAHSQYFVSAIDLIKEAVENEKISRLTLKKKDIQSIKKVIGNCGGNDIIKAALESYLITNPLKVGIRQQTEKENIYKEETYTVADPTAMGQGTNAITLQQVGDIEVVDNEEHSTYSVLLYWSDSGAKLFEDEFDSQEKADEIFSSLQLKLAEAHKLEAEGNHVGSIEAMKAVEKAYQAISAPLVEDIPPITSTNASLEKKAEVSADAKDQLDGLFDMCEGGIKEDILWSSKEEAEEGIKYLSNLIASIKVDESFHFATDKEAGIKQKPFTDTHKALEYVQKIEDDYTWDFIPKDSIAACYDGHGVYGYSEESLLKLANEYLENDKAEEKEASKEKKEVKKYFEDANKAINYLIKEHMSYFKIPENSFAGLMREGHDEIEDFYTKEETIEEANWFKNMNKEATLTKSGMLIDQVTLKNKQELLAYSGGKDGDYLWNKGDEIVYGSYKGATDYITDAVFTPMKSIKFKSVEEARKKAEELTNTESLRDTVNRGLGGIAFNDIEPVKDVKPKEPTVETPSKPEPHLDTEVRKEIVPEKTILDKKLEEEEKAKAAIPEVKKEVLPEVKPEVKPIEEKKETPAVKEAPSTDDVMKAIEEEVNKS